MDTDSDSELVLSFCVHGNPIPKQSFRVGANGGYRDPRVTKWQEEVAWRAKMAMAGHVLIKGNIEVWINFYRKDKTRVDLDNLSKGVLDALNQVVWEDDQQVISLHLTKEVDRKYPGIAVDIYLAK